MGILLKDVISQLAIIPQVCANDPRLYRYINAAQEEIFLAGNYLGIQASYEFKVYNSVITLPYEAEALLAADLWGIPVKVNSQWFEFLQSGPGYQEGKEGGERKWGYNFPDFFDRGEGWCTIQDPKDLFQVQLFCAVPEDPNATCIIEGLDANSNAIRSQITVQNPDGTTSGQWINGIQTPLFIPGQPYVQPAQVFSRITGFNLPTRNSDLSVYAVISGVLYLLGTYPSFMTNPSFRRYHFPAACPLPIAPFRPVTVHALVRRRALPISGPNDRLTISNIPALRKFVTAAWKDEEEQYDTAASLRAQGQTFLEQEFRKGRHCLDRLNIQFRGFMRYPRLPGGL